MALFSGPGQIPTIKGLGLSDKVTIPAGGTYTLSPAGSYWIRTGLYTTIQQYDPYTGSWVRIGGGVVAGGSEYIYSDGVNYRLANQTGTTVGALLTTAGSGYTAAPTFTASAGSPLFKVWIGGAVSTTVSVVSGGTGYTYPPLVVFSPPPVITSGGGIQATGYATLTSGVVSSVTVINQGAGYPSAPTITFFNDPRESPNIAVSGSGVNSNTVTYGSGAAAVATLTGSGTVTGIVVQDHGTAQTTISSIPTLTASSGSAAATAIVCATINAAPTVTAVGVALTGAAARITAEDNFPATAAAYTNPDTQANLVKVRSADIRQTVTAGALAGTGVIYDGGIYTSLPTPLVWANTSVATTAPTATVAVGGVVDTSWVQQL